MWENIKGVLNKHFAAEISDLFICVFDNLPYGSFAANWIENHSVVEVKLTKLNTYILYLYLE